MWRERGALLLGVPGKRRAVVQCRRDRRSLCALGLAGALLLPVAAWAQPTLTDPVEGSAGSETSTGSEALPAAEPWTNPCRGISSQGGTQASASAEKAAPEGPDEASPPPPPAGSPPSPPPGAESVSSEPDPADRAAAAEAADASAEASTAGTARSSKGPVEGAGSAGPADAATTDEGRTPAAQAEAGGGGTGAVAGGSRTASEPVSERELDGRMIPLSPARESPELEGLMNEFMTTGEAIEGRAGGDEPTDFPGPPERPNWFQALRVTRDENPLLEKSCKEQALSLSVDAIGEEMGLDGREEALRAAAAHMREHQEFIKSNQVSHADYLKQIAECRSFCAPLVAQLVQCHVLSVARLDHGIVLFELDSDRVDDRYASGMLSRVASRLAEDAERKAVLIGRASKIGDLRYNRALSARRTLAVKDQLLSHGLPPERVETMWFGWEPPQISFRIANEYGLAELFEAEGMARLNQSVMVVVY